eukprot:TRINITY_DN9686_c0_g8_i1.p2 TRINITY_DN9686_c0_g8~~TRINITY_DN9686_c0_g8_i1.p2  ORF type:complete len:283 (+),score=50.38 TRINITY_DN9686_c0_g8_i1:137-985(+)
MRVSALLEENEGLRRSIKRLQELLADNKRVRLIPNPDITTIKEIAESSNGRLISIPLNQRTNGIKQRPASKNSTTSCARVHNNHCKSRQEKRAGSKPAEKENKKRKKPKLLLQQKNVFNNANLNSSKLSMISGMLSPNLESSINPSKYNSTVQYKSEAISTLTHKKGNNEQLLKNPKTMLNSNNISFNSSTLKVALSNLNSTGRNPNIPRCASAKASKKNPPIASHIIKKPVSYVTETVLANRNAGKGRGVLRSGLSRARCENCAQLLAKGFSTATCLCHKK